MEEQKKYITETVSKLYRQYGIRSITMDDVAREVGISKKTLYEYFKDKKELIQSVIDLGMELMENKILLLRQKKLNAIEFLFEVNKMITESLKNYNPVIDYDLKKYYPKIYKNFIQKKQQNIYFPFVKNLEQGKAEGLYRQEIKSDVIAQLHILRFETKLPENIKNTKHPLPAIIDEIFEYHLRGICSKKGLAFFEKQRENLKIK